LELYSIKHLFGYEKNIWNSERKMAYISEKIDMSLQNLQAEETPFIEAREKEAIDNKENGACKETKKTSREDEEYVG